MGKDGGGTGGIVAPSSGDFAKYGEIFWSSGRNLLVPLKVSIDLPCWWPDSDDPDSDDHNRNGGRIRTLEVP
ncbi:hypothetical protein L2E82_15115 [Cichorium intybus]|uniref:Uncharacterized protein n=1 Tax=Cichorium intybus TaxID=13427 RepID=A0ACB9F1Y2_CICIN|nr:hypothetical protein L2E82_15115 [Cichorium intybus]